MENLKLFSGLKYLGQRQSVFNQICKQNLQNEFNLSVLQQTTDYILPWISHNTSLCLIKSQIVGCQCCCCHCVHIVWG